MISVSPPTEFRSQTLYKAVDAVWSDRHNLAPVEKIQSGINDFGNAVKGFRDFWKDKNDKLKQAEIEGSPTAAQAPVLKKDVSDARAFMGTIVDRSLHFGHPAILKRYVLPCPDPLSLFMTRIPFHHDVHWIFRSTCGASLTFRLLPTALKVFEIHISAHVCEDSTCSGVARGPVELHLFYIALRLFHAPERCAQLHLLQSARSLF
jgi:hypothetical protein